MSICAIEDTTRSRESRKRQQSREVVEQQHRAQDGGELVVMVDSFGIGYAVPNFCRDHEEVCIEKRGLRCGRFFFPRY